MRSCVHVRKKRERMAKDIQHEGIVVGVTNGGVQVKILQMSACSACQAKSLCSAAESSEKIIDCRMIEPLAVGDKVMVTVARRLGWIAVLLAFILPCVVLFISIWGFTYWLENEALGGTIGLVMLLPYYACLALFRKKIKTNFDFIATKSE